MKKIFFILLLSVCHCVYSHSQINVLSDKTLTDSITRSSKPYKLVYILCDYCQPSVERFPELLNRLKEHENVAIFPVCAQDIAAVSAYMGRSSLSVPVYLINLNRKRRLIDFYNPIKAVCKYMDKCLGVSTEKMGASDYCLLDKDNNVILRTDWEMQDSLYFGQLDEFLNRLGSE